MKHKSVVDRNEHKRSSSSIPLHNNVGSLGTTNDVYLTPNEHLSLTGSSHSSLNCTTNNLIKSSSISSLTMIQHESSATSSPMTSNLNLLSKSIDDRQDGLTTASSSSSMDSLTALEEILQRQQTRHESVFPPQKVSRLFSILKFRTITFLSRLKKALKSEWRPIISSHSLCPMLTLSRSLRPHSFRPKFILSHNHFVPYIWSSYILSQNYFVPNSFGPILILSQTYFVPNSCCPIHYVPLQCLSTQPLTWSAIFKQRQKKKKHSY